MHVKHANLLGKVTRLSVGALLATQLSACSALGMKTPGEIWKGVTAEREPQMVDGPRRLPMLNKELLQATQSGQQPKVEHLIEQDRRAASGIYLPTESGMPHTEPAIEMRDPGANAPRSEAETETSEFAGLVNRIGNWLSSAAEPAVADANIVSEPVDNDTQVSMQNVATINNLAVQSAVSNSVAVQSNSAGYRPARKPISGNPVQFYAAPGAKLDAANHKEVLEDAPNSSVLRPAKSGSGKQASMEDAPVALRPEMRAEIVEDNQLFHQSLALSAAPLQAPFPQENAPSAKAVLPAAGTREEKDKVVEPLVSSQPQILPTVDPNSNDPYPPLSSVPQTPTRLGEAKAERPELLDELKSEGNASAEKRTETERQAEEEASESLKNMPAQEMPSMQVETPGETTEPVSAPRSLNDSDNTPSAGQAFAAIAPAAGDNEQLLGHMDDAAGNQELKADEKAAVNVLDSSLASPNSEEKQISVEADKAEKEAPVKKQETLANTEESDAPKSAARSKKHVIKKAKASKPAEPRLSKPLDYSTVKPLMLPESYATDANTTANIINENKAASQSPSVETLLSVDEALNQRNALAPAETTQAVPVTQPELQPMPQAIPVARPAISTNEAVVLASGIVLPPAQFTQPIAGMDTTTPMPSLPPLAPVAANEFLLNRIVRQFVGIFSVAPNYVYLPVLNENRTVRYLPDSRYMQP